MTETKNGYRAISEDIASKITDGSYAPDTALPAERELMALYKVERTTVRRALALLEKEGKIVKKPNIGTFVAPLAAISAFGKSDTENSSKTSKKASEKITQSTEKTTKKYTKSPKSTKKANPAKKSVSKALPVAVDAPQTGFISVKTSSFDMTNARFLAAKDAFDRLFALGHTRLAVVTADKEAYALLAGLLAANGVAVSDASALCKTASQIAPRFSALNANKRAGGFTAVLTATAAEAEAILTEASSRSDTLSVMALQTEEDSRISGFVFDDGKARAGLGEAIGVADSNAVYHVRLAVLPTFHAGKTLHEPKDIPQADALPAYLL